ncbi:FAD-binding oxidoreductase [Candidatus Palauibacter polyketidifaciens]|uniref:NAD(P)/FAD-dependent oxidoreductase n=1 Tax=Candidatus Palauibacter polyketidifaciens TaxID=3056740 RepID=UPI00238BF565|nr:FAD-binding oxidoreductase [Candidatus Palauibacter polyketidifaciens]MDE2720881.1 FAD-binding oxidoreductase [Candidatus Palauibacter polyketidifaciens]
MKRGYDFAIAGGGVIGASIAFHLAELSDASVALFDRGEVCGGGTGRSCAVIRSHYSVASNTRLTLRSLEVFRDFREALGEDGVACGFVNSGYLILAGPGSFADRLADNLARQRELGADTSPIGRAEARELHPWLELEDVAAIGWEPASGYADPVATTLGYVTAAQRRGVAVFEHTPVERLCLAPDGGTSANRVTGVTTPGGTVEAGCVVSAVGPWTRGLYAESGLSDDAVEALRLQVSRHVVLTFGGSSEYGPEIPIVKDLTVNNKMYFRPADGGVVLVGTGDFGDPLEDPDRMTATAPRDLVSLQRTQIGARMPAFEGARLTDSWVGPYDITPDWNPVLGPAPDLPGLYLAYGFSGHGFKLAPAIGRCVAQSLLGETPDVDLAPYRPERFRKEALLLGAYGVGSIS